jgi:hypothetical protein
VKKLRIQIVREEQGLRQTGAESAEQQEFVVNISPYNAYDPNGALPLATALLFRRSNSAAWRST